MAPDNDQVHRHLGFVLLELGQPRAALRSFQTALELNPRSQSLAERIDALSRRLGVAGSISGSPKTGVVQYPSGAPRVLSEARLGPDGRYVSDGIRTEWYENGALKRFALLASERSGGIDVAWEPSGALLPRTER